MQFNDNRLPETLNKFLEEIYNDEELRDAFFDCDIEIYENEWIKDLTFNEAGWKADFGDGEYNYDTKPFARSGDGGLWVILNDKMVGYIGTEGECGIVAGNIDEFMNIVAVYRGYPFDFFDIDVLKSEEAFMKLLNETNKECKFNKVFDAFIDKHEFEREAKEIFKMIKSGLTVKPFFIIKATDDEWTDSYSLLGHDDEQKALENFINNYL